jgi:hypothetical protein
MTAPIDIVRAAWGDPVPDWIAVLAERCTTQPQRLVAQRLGYSAGLVSQLLRNRYKGNLAAIESAVRGAWMGSTVTCPVMGTIASDVCNSWQRKARTFVASSNNRVRMYRACNKCPRMTGDTQ